MARSYHQTCGLAKALDLLGERWTLLVVRELALGPKRFGDLLAALDGINANLLSARLTRLTEAGIAEKTTLPPPARVAAYRLTARGEALRPALDELSLWGFELVLPPAPEDRARASWIALSMTAATDAGALGDLDLRAELAIDDELLAVRVRDGAVSVEEAADPDATLRVRTDLPTFAALAGGEAEPAAEHVVAGDVAALRALLEGWRLPSASRTLA